MTATNPATRSGHPADTIAIVGLSGLYPDAGSLDRLYENLAGGRDSVRPLSERRRRYLMFEPSERFSAVASLEEIDAFDHAFFSISLREAEFMDPQQRLLLQLACSAIESAGLSLGELRGSDTAVLVGAATTDYYRLLDVPDPLAVSGNLPSGLAARIAYQLGLRGPSMVIDTACSSSLTAVVEACDQLALGRADYALVGGMNLFFAEDPLASEVGIASSDGRCKSFDAAADGSGWGEGGGVAFLTTLRRARAERLPVRAVIRGGAVNQDAERSNGITAPSPVAQAEVIARAWERAGIDPETLGYVEAHGTGTELGDPIEIQGLDQAFGRFTEARGICPVGSIKTNIGHLTGAAGLAGLTKVVLSLEHRELFPSLHYREANPFIDFESSAVYVNTERRSWESNGTPRRAGVSSFGLSGTNAHVVLEEAPEPEAGAPAPDGPVVVTVSARTAPALDRYLVDVERALEGSEVPLDHIAFTLNRGRDDHPYRFAAAVEDLEALRRALADARPVPAPGRTAPATGRGVVFLLSGLDGGEGFDPAWLDALSGRCPEIAAARRECADLMAEPASRAHDFFAFQWGLVRQWERLGLSPSKIVGTGSGSAVSGLLQGGLDLRAALERAAELADAENRIDRTRLGQVVEKLLAAKPAPLFLEIGALAEVEGPLHRELSALRDDRFPELRVFASLDSADLEGSALLPTLADLYRSGADVDWERHYEEQAPRRVVLPTYPFEATPCWNPSILKAPAEPGAVSASEPEPEPEPEPASDDGPEVLLDEDGTLTERTLARIWAEALTLDTVERDADYFDLGGHSLNGMQVITRIEETFGIEVDFDDIYDNPSLRQLAECVDGLAAAAEPEAAPAPVPTPGQTPARQSGLRMPPIRRAPAGEEAPLSFTEQRLWFLDQFEPASPFYNIPFALRVRGPLDPAGIVRGLERIRDRHEVLRTTFPAVEGRAVRTLVEDLPFPVRFVDLTGLPDLPGDARERALEAVGAEEASRGFDLAHGPLARATLVRLAEEDHALLVTMHHIISDLWSMNLLIRELTLSYRDLALGLSGDRLPELPVQYSDFARTQRAWLQGEALERLTSYWRTRLEGAPPILTLPTDRPRPPVQTYRGRQHHFTFPPELVQRLHALARDQDSTLFMVLMAGLQALLHRYTGESKVPVGTPIAGRSRTEIEGLIGFFTNTLVIATDLSGDPTGRELLRRVRENALGAYAHQDLPFEKLLEEVHPERSLSHSPVFQVMLALQNIAIEVPDLAGLSIEASEPESGTTQFDLTVSVREDVAGLVGRVQYNTNLYAAGTIERMVDHLESVLDALASEPDRRLSRLPMWREGERETVVRRWNDTARELPGSDRPLNELVAAQAEQTPDRTAVVFEGETLTYAGLMARCGRLAARLERSGVGPESVVALCAERSTEMIVALLAILECGAAYLPLDPETPDRRLRYMLDRSGARVVLTRLDGGDALSRFGPSDDGRREVIDLGAPDAFGEAAPRIPAHRPSVAPENAAYTIYTSGTTGQPKGVVVPHRGIVNRLLWMQEAYRLEASDRVLQKTPYTFDVSVWELFWPLLAGATLVVARPGGHRDPEYLAETIRRRAITTLHFVPSMLTAFLSSARTRPLPSLRRVICSGEALGLDQVESFFRSVGDLDGDPASPELHNLYGPTEASVDVSHRSCRPGESTPTVPIGRPIANTKLYVLDPAMEPVPMGASGELFIGGLGLARGYAADPAQTAERFVPDPFSEGGRLYRTGDRTRFFADGEIEFLGRFDHQLKIRGFRIEAGEVENALAAHERVRQAVVTAAERAGHPRLVAYVVPDAGEPPTLAELRTHLAESLPDYMIPAQLVMLDELPLGPNGKVDRGALPELGDERPDLEAGYIEPRNRVEKVLAGIWSRLLAVERVGIRDNFFALGGDSILSIQVVARAAEEGIRLTPRQMFEHQTIVGLAAVAGESRAVQAEQGPVTGAVELTPPQRWLLDMEPRDLDHWNQAVMLAAEGEPDQEALRGAVEALVERHDALRHRFRRGESSGWEQVAVAPEEAVPEIAWEDLSSVQDPERAAAVTRRAEAAQRELDLEDGPLLRFVGLRWPGQWRLLLVIHHLVVDGVSWRILLADLERAYRQLAQLGGGGPVDLGPKTTSFRYWADRLRRFAGEELLAEELPYWLEVTDPERVEILTVPRDGQGDNLESSTERVEVELDSERTDQLLQEVPNAYSTSVEEVLLTALGQALAKWASRTRTRVLVDVEGHGREELFDEVDLTRTVGWFTSIYPVCLPVHLQDPDGESLTRTKEILRGVPGRGVGYGMLRHLGDEETRRRLAERPRPEIVFNYLGRLDEVLARRGPFRPATEDVGPFRSPRARRPHLLEVSAEVSGGRLAVRCAYSRNLHDVGSVERLMELVNRRLLALIDHCLGQEAERYTPSDFPDQALSDQDLQEIVDQLGGSG